MRLYSTSDAFFSSIVFAGGWPVLGSATFAATGAGAGFVEMGVIVGLIGFLANNLANSAGLNSSLLALYLTFAWLSSI